MDGGEVGEGQAGQAALGGVGAWGAEGGGENNGNTGSSKVWGYEVGFSTAEDDDVWAAAELALKPDEGGDLVRVVGGDNNGDIAAGGGGEGVIRGRIDAFLEEAAEESELGGDGRGYMVLVQVAKL